MKLHDLKYDKLHTKIYIIIINYDQFPSRLIYGQGLSLYHAVLNCYAKTVTLKILGKERLKWKGCTCLHQLKVLHVFRLRKW